MKKNYILWISLLVITFTTSNAQKNPVWDWPSCRNTNAAVSPEQPGTIYLGDQGTFGHDSWADVNGKWPKWQVVIHTSADINNGSYGNWSDYSNIQNKTGTSPRFTSIGQWYWGMKVEYTEAGNTTGWYCRNDANWYGMYGIPTSNLTITVSPLVDPTVGSATASSNTQINLSWTKWNNKNVMIVRKLTSAAASTIPSQGSTYAVGSTLGTGTVIYNSNGTTCSSTGLIPGTSYTYIFYSENWSYYSPGDATTSATTTSVSATTDHFRTKATGNWSDINTWESSSDNANWISATLVPDAAASSTTILSSHTVTLNQNIILTSLNIETGGGFIASDATPRTLTLTKSTQGNATTLSNNGTWQNGSGGSKVIFTGAPGAGDAIHVVSGTIQFQNITVNKTGGVSNVGASFSSGSAISETMEIGAGGFVSTAPPAGFYTSSAILKFNQGSGATYDVNVGDYSWSTTEVPQNITISSGTVNLNANRTATGNLLIDGGTLVLNNNTPTLTINGNWTRTSGSFTPGTGTIVLSGADNKVVNTGSSGSAYNLTISKTGGASVTLENDFTVNNSLTINSGSVLIVNPGTGLTVTGTLTNDAGTAGLVVKADASGFGSLIESDGVNATVESYISQNSSSSWHFISSPVSAALADVFEGKYLQKHTESNNSYTDITSLTDPLTVMKGFAVWGNPGFTAYYEGQLNAGNKSIGINRTEAGINSGWNLVGNPYPSVIDWDATSGWTKTNVDNTIYIEKNGGFASYTGKVGIIPGEGTNGGSNLIAPGQGFFVSATSIGAGTLAVNNDVRVHSSIPFLKNATTVPILRLELSGNTFSDESVVRFVPESTNDFDGEYDAHKLFGDVPGLAQCYTLGSLPLAINSIPEATSIPLGVKANTAGTYTIAATELLEIPVVALEDTKTGTFTDLISGSYTFTIEPGENELRFMLHFGTTSVPENEKSISSIYSYQQTVYVNLADNTQGDIYIYNLAGQLVTAKESASGNVRIGLNSMGVYMVKVVTEKETLTQKVVIR